MRLCWPRNLAPAQAQHGEAVRRRVQRQHFMALLGGGRGNVARGLGAAQADFEDLARGQTVQCEAGADIGHRAGLCGDVQHSIGIVAGRRGIVIHKSQIQVTAANYSTGSCETAAPDFIR